MSATEVHEALEARLAMLEERLDGTTVEAERRTLSLDGRLRRLEARAGRLHEARPRLAEAAGVRPPRSAPSAGGAGRSAADASDSATVQHGGPRPGMSFGDVLGGRVLAWLGGTATALGVILFLALAISHGWIGESARVLLAAAASAALMGAGGWLRARGGRTEAAVAMVAAGTAGLYASLIVAGDVYGLVPSTLAVAGGLLVGALATVLAIRWAGRAIGGLGLIGALLSGVLLGAPLDTATVVMLALTATCAMTVVAWQRWGWLALATVLVCAPQWAIWMLDGRAVALELVVLAWFAALGLAGAIAVQLRAPADRLAPASASACTVSACVLAFVGHAALGGDGGALPAEAWLVALAGAYLIAGAWRSSRVPIVSLLRWLLIAIGVTLADVAFGLAVHGVALAVGWSAAAVAFAWLARRSTEDRTAAVALSAGVGAHLALALVRALLEAPPSELGGQAQLAALIALASLAGACIACGRLSATTAPARWRLALDALGLAAIAYLTASALSDGALVVAWALEGLALARVGASSEERTARVGAGAFIAAAALCTLVEVAPPTALVDGHASLGAAALALGTLALVGARIASMLPAGSVGRQRTLIGAAGALLYLASVATVSAFADTSATASGGLLELSVRQQGQVALSVLWSLAGLGALVLGLRHDLAVVRTAGVALLLATVGKVFLYDLSTLTSIYRVISFIVLGLLLLAGAFAYQRLRPPPLPDMRAVHPSQR